MTVRVEFVGGPADGYVEYHAKPSRGTSIHVMVNGGHYYESPPYKGGEVLEVKYVRKG